MIGPVSFLQLQITRFWIKSYKIILDRTWIVQRGNQRKRKPPSPPSGGANHKGEMKFRVEVFLVVMKRDFCLELVRANTW